MASHCVFLLTSNFVLTTAPVGPYKQGMNSKHYDPEKLKSLREQRGETQETVAKALRVHRQTIYRAEKGLDVPYELLCDLAKYYGIEVVKLLHPTPLEAGMAA